MKKDWFYAACLVCLAVACSGTSQPVAEEICTVDVAGAMEKPVELKVSELGSDVRYVTLETTDSCLIDNNPEVLLLDKHIVVYSRKDCFLFDKANGKFICKVGRGGDDPEAYSFTQPTYSDADGLLYFKREPDGLQKYDLQGNYQGKITIPTPPTAPNGFVFTDSLIVGHYNAVAQQYNASSLLLFNADGKRIDTIPSLLPVLPEMQTKDITSISVLKRGLAGIILSSFSDGSNSASIAGIPFLWKNGDKVRFKESFVDTVYTLERDHLVPSIVFATGKWHWGAEARISTENGEQHLLMTTVFETDHNIFFQCIRGLYDKEPETFNGIYDKKAGTTHIYAEKEGITDDLTDFMPFHPKTCSAKGEYGTIVSADKVLGWIEEHPEAAGNVKLAELKKMTEDSNPVVVITIPQ